MRRIWIVDDTIPIHLLFGSARTPTRLDREIVELLISKSTEDQWDEREVRGLCATLCVDEFEASFFLSPEAAKEHIVRGDIPPDGLIFDWEGPGFGSATNVAVLRDVLTQTIALIQVYTRLSHEEVDGHLEDLRREFPDRVLPTLTKADVTPADLRDKVRNARAGTIAGSIADAVRGHVRRALEGTLIEMCTMPQAGISAVVEGNAENLLSLMLAKVRDLLGVDASEILMKAAEGTPTAESTLALRRLLSAWYYFFPSDDRVRRGDIVETIGGGTELRFVVTPSCDLVRFRKKTGGVLTLLTAVALDTAGKDRLRKAALLPTTVRGSITAGVDGSADAVLPLPNIPVVAKDRTSLEDYVLLCHSWETLEVAKSVGAAEGLALCYRDVPTLRRRCTLAEPFVGAALAKIAGVMFSPGVPDFPAAERDRLRVKLAP